MKLKLLKQKNEKKHPKLVIVEFILSTYSDMKLKYSYKFEISLLKSKTDVLVFIKSANYILN